MGLLLSNETQLFKLGVETGFYFLELSIHSPMAGNDHDVVPQDIGRLRQAISLPDAAADAISYHGVAQLGAGGKPQAIIAQAILSAVDHKAPPRGTLALLVEAAEQMILF